MGPLEIGVCWVFFLFFLMSGLFGCNLHRVKSILSLCTVLSVENETTVEIQNIFITPKTSQTPL